MEKNGTADYEGYKASGWYDRDSVDALNRRLAGYSTDYDALKRQAEAEYAPAYQAEQDALAARLEEQTAAARAEQAALNRGYERQRAQTNARYDQSAAALRNDLNARGLGRSTLTASQGAYLEGQRNQALAGIDQAEADDVAAINSRIARLAEETARSRQTSAATYAQQLEKRINDLRSSNQTAAVGLQLQIAALQRQGYEAYQNWLLKERAQSLDEAEYRQKYGLNESGGRSGSAGSRGAAAPKAASVPAAAEKKNALADLVRTVAGGIRSAVNALARTKRSAGSTPTVGRESSVKVKAR